MSDKVPDIIADRYQVKSVLGKGGMGFVLEAFDPLLGIDVALKLMKSDDSGQAAARMQREAMAAGKLKHANIARVYDFGQTPDGEPYMVMELLKGKTLAEMIEDAKPGQIEPAEAVSILISIIDGLQSAHSQDIVHRDLKPDNVFVLANQMVKLVDFGIAKIGAGDQMNTAKGDFEGSPLYMSPEQAQGLDTDSRSDIYSFGCLAFEVFTGIPPFQGKSALETISQQISSVPPPVPEHIAEKLPAELIVMIQKCLEKNPDSRPQNTDKVLDYLEAARLSLKNVTAQSTIENKECKTDFKKKSSSVYLGLAVSALLLILAATFFLLTFKKPKAAHQAKTVVKEETETVAPAWFKDEPTLEPKGRKFEFAQDKGVYMARPKVAIVDEDLKELKGYVKLRNLFLDYTRIDGSGLVYVEDLPLKLLSISYGNIEDKAMQSITKMKTLEWLEIGTPHLSDEGLKKILTLHNLYRFSVGSDKITDKSVSTFSKLTDLTTFSLYAPQMTEAVVPALYQMKNLNNLCLIKLKLNPDIGVKVAKINSLYTLGIMEIPSISDKSLKAIAKLNLYWLDLGGTSIGGNQLSLLSKDLPGLSLRKTGVSSKNLENLTKLPKLSVLNFGENKLTDEHARVLSHLKLTELTLVKSEITFKQFLMLSNIKSLRKLDIRECNNITPANLQEFQSIFKLKHRADCEVTAATEIPKV